MSATIKNTEDNTVTLEIKIEKDDFQKAVNQSYNKNKGKFTIQGFRKGKAPRKVIEAHYGKGIFYEDAIEFAFPDAYKAALEETGIEAASRPSLEEVTEVGEDGATFIVKVAVKPEVKLGDYKGAEIKSMEPNITDADIQAEIDKMIDQNARMISVEDTPAEDGDSVNIDFEGFVDGEAFDGGKADGHILELGSHAFIDGFEEQLVGKKNGEECDVIVTFPEEYGAPDLAGKEATFKVTVNEVLKKELPELDDEFVKDVSEFDTVDELKDDTRKKLTEQEEKILRQAAETAVLEYAIDNAEVTVSDLMIEEEAEHNLQEMEQQLSGQGLSMDQYFQFTGTDKNEFVENVKNDAERNLKLEMILEAITEAEDLEASEEEVDAEIAKYAEQFGKSVEEYKKDVIDDNLSNYLKAMIARRKAVESLIDAAVVVEEVEEAEASDEE
ncbi:MAG: trigger factor [Eubacteriaceae bacterium]|jgi:trigger factor